jgi:hypothetical protein
VSEDVCEKMHLQMINRNASRDVSVLNAYKDVSLKSTSQNVSVRMACKDVS